MSTLTSISYLPKGVVPERREPMYTCVETLLSPPKGESAARQFGFDSLSSAVGHLNDSHPQLATFYLRDRKGQLVLAFDRPRDMVSLNGSSEHT